MPLRRAARRQTFVLTGLFGAASAAVLIVLAANGRIALLEALGAAIAIGGALYIVVRLMLQRYQGIGAYLEALLERREAPPPQIELGAGGGIQSSLAGTAQRLGEAIAEREQRLKSELAAVRELLSAVPAPLVMIDRQQKVVEANAAAEAVLGRAAIGRPFTHGLRDPLLAEAIGAALEARAEREIELVLKVPVERSFKVSVRPLRTEAANGAAAIVLLLDQTDAKRVDRMRVDFVANVSHELRTPLTSLIGFIESLRGPARDDAEARE
ncbi:MAG: histidine kinase dimerization/phospho-acceptor domain-containing protein, partial [Alphaproteobacteria bacterium]